MRTLLLQLCLLPLASVAYASPPSAACTPWSTSFWGDAVITSQAEADEYSCFRRIVGSVTLVTSAGQPIVLPKLRGIFGDLHIVFTQSSGRLEQQQAMHTTLPALEEVRGDIELRYTHGDARVPTVCSRSRPNG